MAVSSSSTAPVSDIETSHAESKLEKGIALCLSGGGYRATLFHTGVLWRLNEVGMLPQLARISSVSGGSITAATLGLHWDDLDFDANGVGQSFTTEFVDRILALTSKTIDAFAIGGGLLLPGTIGDFVARAYDKHLFGGATLQDLPDDRIAGHPRFVINATNVQSGVLWRFSRPYMRDYRVGEVINPKVPLAVAVAASSAFPPVLSPVHLELHEDDFEPGSGQDLQKEPYTSDVYLSDGGVYDNLGLETAYKRYTTLLVSDGGHKAEPDPSPKTDWARHSKRIIDIISEQVVDLRKRLLINAFQSGERHGTYLGIGTPISAYNVGDPLGCDAKDLRRTAAIPTRLKSLDTSDQQDLINWGYAICDAAIEAFAKVHLAAEFKINYARAEKLPY
jgi:NTE family protein